MEASEAYADAVKDVAEVFSLLHLFCIHHEVNELECNNESEGEEEAN
jgi:hypothetical protein